MNAKQLTNIFSQVKVNEMILCDPDNQGPLGIGGSGVVYPISYSKDGKEPEAQALKVIDIVELAEKRVEQEGLKQEMIASIKKEKFDLYKNELKVGKKISECRCEHLIKIHDTYVVGNPDKNECLCAIRMPRYETLETLCQKNALDENTVIRLGTHICAALKVLHYDAKDQYYRASRMGIMVHMDIKPSNIFCRQEDGAQIFMLGDYGTLVDKREGVAVGGTEGYLAPELTWLLEDQQEETTTENGTPAETADIFALGLTLLYCLLRGEKALQTANYRKARCNGLKGKKPRNCSKYLWEVIQTATDQDPAKRYQTAVEMQTALEEVNNKKAKAAIRKSKITNAISFVVGIGVAAGACLVKSEQDKNKTKEECSYGSNGTYNGEMKDNHPHGQGTFRDEQGNEITGECDEDTLIET